MNCEIDTPTIDLPTPEMLAQLENHVGYNSTVYSYGFGLRSWLPWHLRLDMAYAKPLGPPFPGAATPGGRFLALVTCAISFH